MQDAQFLIQIGPDGRNSIQDLIDRFRQPRPKKLHINRIHLDTARLSLDFPAERSANAILDLPAAQIENNSGSIGLSWSMQLHFLGGSVGQESVLVCRGRLGSTPDKTNDQAENHLRLSLDRFDLSHPALKYLLNLALANNPSPTAIERLEGFSSLHAKLALREHNICTVTGRLALDNVSLQPQGDLAWLDQAGVSADFQLEYDLATGVTRITDLNATLPGLQGSITGRFDPAPDAETIQLSIRQGRLNPQALLHASPAVEQSPSVVGAAPDLSGNIDFDLDYRSSERQDNTRFHLDAAGLGLMMAGVYKKAGDPLSVDLQSFYDRYTGQWRLDPIRLNWLSLHADAAMTLPPKQPVDQSGNDPNIPATTPLSRLIQARKQGFTLKADLDIGDVNDLRYTSEHLFDFLPGVSLEGPLHVKIELPDGTTDLPIHVALRLPETVHCTLRDVNQPETPIIFEKPQGLSLEAQATVIPILDTTPHGFTLQAHCSLGPACLSVNQGILGWAKDPAESGYIKGEIIWTDIEQWLTLLPPCQLLFQTHGVGLNGGGSADFNVKRTDINEYQADGHVQLDQTAIGITGQPADSLKPSLPPDDPSLVFSKSAGQPAQITFKVTQSYKPSQKLKLNAKVELANLAAILEADVLGVHPADDSSAWPIQPQSLSLTVIAEKLDRFKSLLPRFFQQQPIVLGPCSLSELAGAAKMEVQTRFKESSADVQWQFDATDAAFKLQNHPEQTYLWAKNPGIRCVSEGMVRLSHAQGVSVPDARLQYLTPLAVDVEDFQVLFGDSRFELLGRASLAEITNRNRLFQSNNCDQAQLDLRLRLSHGDELIQTLVKSMPSRQLSLAGVSQVEAKLSWDRPQNKFTCTAGLDLTQTAMEGIAGPARTLKFQKPAGDPVKCDLAADIDVNRETVNLRQARVVIMDNIFTAAGAMKGFQWAVGSDTTPKLQWRQGEIAFTLDAPHLDQPVRWCTALKNAEVSGRFNARAECSLDLSSNRPLKINAGRADGDVSFQTPAAPAHLVIRDLALSPSGLLIPALQCRLGKNDMLLRIELTEPGQTSSLVPTGRIDLQANSLDLDDLAGIVASFMPAGDPNQPVSQPADLDYQPLLTAACRFDLNGAADVASITYTDPKADTRLTLQELRAAWKFQSGKFNIDFLAGLNGGVVNGALRGDLNDPSNIPIVHDFTSQKLRADDNLQPIVESEFPGMEVTGFISEKYTLHNTLQGLLDKTTDWQGTGTTLCEQGILFGPGGPGWMIKVFPGLKLVEYPWESMTNTYEKFADGHKNNHMFIIGESYDIYLDGVSTPIHDPDKYNQVMLLMENDLRQVRLQLASLDAGELNISDAKARQIRRRAAGLERLWQKHQAGQTLLVTEIDYNVGALLSGGKKGLFDKPVELLRIPIFRSQGYVMGQEMIGLTTTNISFP